MNKLPRKAEKCSSFSRLLVSDGKTSSLVPVLNEPGKSPPQKVEVCKIHPAGDEYDRFTSVVSPSVDIETAGYRKSRVGRIVRREG